MELAKLLSGVDTIVFSVILYNKEVYIGKMNIDGLREEENTIIVCGDNGEELSLFGTILSSSEEGVDIEITPGSYVSIEYV